MIPNFRRNAIGAAVLSLASFASLAQAQPAPQAQPADATPAATLPEIAVTGNPLGASELIAPNTTLAGEKLLMRSD